MIRCCRYAFGEDELLPLSKAGRARHGDVGITILDSLDTLLLMNLTQVLLCLPVHPAESKSEFVEFYH